MIYRVDIRSSNIMKMIMEEKGTLKCGSPKDVCVDPEFH